MSDLTVVVREGNTLVILSKVAGVDGTNITQSSLSALAWSLYDQVAGAAVVASTALTIASQIYNSLQTFNYPSGRTFQYNFKHIITGTYLDDGGHKYVAKYVFTDLQSYPYVLEVDIDVRDIT